MATTVNLKKLLHPKQWEMRTSSPVASTAGAFMVSDKFNLLPGSKAFLLTTAAAVYMFEGDEDSWTQLPASGATGTFGAGACGEVRGLSAMGGVFTQTATAGGASSITTNRTIVRTLTGARIRVVAGTGAGFDGTVVSNTLGANAVITTSGGTFDGTTQFQVYGGSLWFFNPGAAGVGFTVYDRATNTWTARSVAGISSNFAIDAQLVSTTSSAGVVATGTATAGGASTLTNSGKAWGTNMWANYQLRIVSGTGAGQIRTIASNTGTVITTSAAWTVNPDATSVYAIEGNDDYFYLAGNNAVTLYRYSVAGNTWSTLTPTAARAGGMGAGATLNWVDNVAGWNNETLVNHLQAGTVYRQNGRYLYSFRGAAANTLDIYDIAANTWISNVPYGNQQETFSTGSSSCDFDGGIYIHKESTGRVFRFDVAENNLKGLTTNVLPQGAVLAGNKMFVLPYVDGGTELNFLYQLQHTGSVLTRQLLV